MTFNFSLLKSISIIQVSSYEGKSFFPGRGKRKRTIAMKIATNSRFLFTHAWNHHLPFVWFFSSNVSVPTVVVSAPGVPAPSGQDPRHLFPLYIMHEATAEAALESCRCCWNRGRQTRSHFTERARLWGRTTHTNDDRSIWNCFPFHSSWISRREKTVCRHRHCVSSRSLSFFLLPSYFRRVSAPFSFRIRAESIIIFRSCSRRALSFNLSSHWMVPFFLFVY